MAANTLKDRLISAIDNMSTDQQQALLQYATDILAPEGMPTRTFLDRLRAVNIDPNDLAIMKRAAEEDCERIDLDEWQ
jgi:hypothetical protein